MKADNRRRTNRLETDGFATRGRRRSLNSTGYTNIGFKAEDLNKLNEVGKEIARKTGYTVTARQVVMHLATNYLRDRV